MKILIIYALIGDGHYKAAQAIKEAIKIKYPEIKVQVIDALNYLDPIYKKIYIKSYLLLINRIPRAWGYIYSKLNDKSADHLIKKTVSYLSTIQADKLIEFIYNFQPDLIVHTHFLSAGILSLKTRKNRRFKKIKNFIIVTDYNLHSFWVQKNISLYFVPTKKVEWILLKRHGIEKQKISVQGIPVRRIFLEKQNNEKTKLQLKIKNKWPSVLFMANGYKKRTAKIVVNSLIKTKEKINLLIVCGKNKKLEQELKIIKTPNMKILTFSFVEDINKLMAISSLIITKAGGLTVTECLVMGLPMIIFQPRPGQEERNTDYLLENSAALKAGTISELQFKTKKLLLNKNLLNRLKNQALKISQPNSAFKIAKILKEYL